MSTALSIFDAGQMPAHIAAMNEEAGNIVARASMNAMLFDNSGFSVNVNGKKTKLMRTTADGEEEAVQIVNLVVIDYHKDRGREFYAKPYNAAAPAMPDCWSEDGKVPHENVPAKQCATCAACPKSKKGSSQTAAGGAAVACSQFQKLAVIPVSALDSGAFPPLRLKIKITSIWDKDGQEGHPGWYAWSQYLDHLTSKGVRSTGLLPTKVKFDKSVSYAKLLFAPGKDWLSAEQIAKVRDLMLSDPVKELLTSTYTPSSDKTGSKPLPVEEEEEELQAAPVPAQARAKPAAKPVDDEEEASDVETPEQRAAALRASKKAEADAIAQANVAKAAAAAAKAKSVAVDDEEEDIPIPAKAAKATPPVAIPDKVAATSAKVAPAKGAIEAPKELADMLGSWDD